MGEDEDGFAVFSSGIGDRVAEEGKGSRLVAGCCHLVFSSIAWVEMGEMEC